MVSFSWEKALQTSDPELFLKTDSLLCAVSDWKGIWVFLFFLFFFNPLDLVEEQNSSVKLSAEVFS